jgi:hypothetical protein
MIADAGEPVQKADDVLYDRALRNRMRMADVPVDEINYLMSLPTAPEVDLDDFSLVDSTQWFFVAPDYSIGIVFMAVGECVVRAEVVFNGRVYPKTKGDKQ